jgi:hypothetical protein
MAVGVDANAKEQALLDAQRKAVIEAAGVFIDAQTIIQNYEQVSDRILTRARGYITDTKTIRTWEEGGLTHCVIVATVGVDDLKRDWSSALPHLIRRHNEPRCLVVFTEDNDIADNVAPKLGGGCAHRLERLLRENGFRLIDKATVERVLDKDTEAAALSGDVQALAARARSFEAELLVYGEAEANPLGPFALRGVNVFRWELSLNARVVRLDTAEVIISDTYPSKPYMHMSQARRCGNDGFGKLANEAGPKLLHDLTEAWTQRFRHEIFEVRFNGCAPSVFRQVIYPVISRLPGVRADNGVNLRGTAPSEANTEIHWAGDMHSLSNAIGTLEIKTTEDFDAGEIISFEEIASSGNRIQFRTEGCE